MPTYVCAESVSRYVCMTVAEEHRQRQQLQRQQRHFLASVLLSCLSSLYKQPFYDVDDIRFFWPVVWQWTSVKVNCLQNFLVRLKTQLNLLLRYLVQTVKSNHRLSTIVLTDSQRTAHRVFHACSSKSDRQITHPPNQLTLVTQIQGTQTRSLDKTLLARGILPSPQTAYGRSSRWSPIMRLMHQGTLASPEQPWGVGKNLKLYPGQNVKMNWARAARVPGWADHQYWWNTHILWHALVKYSHEEGCPRSSYSRHQRWKETCSIRCISFFVQAFR